MAVPSATAVTTPFATVATAVLFEDQVRFLFVAFVGAIVATNGDDACPTPRSNVALSNAHSGNGYICCSSPFIC